MKKTHIWYKVIANAIMEGKTFDVTENELGATKVSQLIADKILENEPLFSKVQNLPHYVGIADRNLSYAIYYLQEVLGTTVYRSKNGDSRNLEYLTIDPTYRDAKDKEIERIRKLVGSVLRSSRDQLSIVAPQRKFDTLLEREVKTLPEPASHFNQE